MMSVVQKSQQANYEEVSVDVDDAPANNVVILTAGLAGSSVLTSLLVRGGYWSGKSTFKKRDYDTWENDELIAVNNRIIESANLSGDWTMEFDEAYIEEVQQGFDDRLLQRMEKFVESCEQHNPWVWKDPRLWLTIRHWHDLLDAERTVFVVIRRDPLQAWISATLRRQIQTIDYLKAYDAGIHDTIFRYLDEKNWRYVDVLYEDLMCQPATVIGQLNKLVGTSLTVDDLAAVFKGTLYRKQYGWPKLLHASAIYMKNFRVRYR